MAKPSASKAEKEHMDAVAQLGCIVHLCGGPATIHHCGTHMGGGRCHFCVLPLCHYHHQGPEGIDGKVISKPQWETRFGTEEELLEVIAKLLGKPRHVHLSKVVPRPSCVSALSI